MWKGIATIVAVIGFFLVAASAGASDCGEDVDMIVNIIGLGLMLLGVLWLRFLLYLESERYFKSREYRRIRDGAKKIYEGEQ